MTYLNVASTNRENLQLMANQRAYTTQAEENAAKQITLNHYSAKRTLIITSIISIIALAAIFGKIIHPYAGMVAVGMVIPLGIWLAIRSKHEGLKKLHQMERERCIDIVMSVTKFLNDLRSLKIITVMAGAPRVEEAERQFDQNNSYLEIAKEAQLALLLMQKHYQIRNVESRFCKAEQKQLWDFVLACSAVGGTSENKSKPVIVIEQSIYTHQNVITTKTASFHNSISVLKQDNTLIYYR